VIQLAEEEIPKINQKNDYAIVAITKHSAEIARKLSGLFPNGDLYYPHKFAKGDEEGLGIQLYDGNVRILLSAIFYKYKGLILFISLGAVVRMIAPLLKDKKSIRQSLSSMIGVKCNQCAFRPFRRCE